MSANKLFSLSIFISFLGFVNLSFANSNPCASLFETSATPTITGPSSQFTTQLAKPSLESAIFQARAIEENPIPLLRDILLRLPQTALSAEIIEIAETIHSTAPYFMERLFKEISRFALEARQIQKLSRLETRLQDWLVSLRRIAFLPKPLLANVESHGAPLSFEVSPRFTNAKWVSELEIDHDVLARKTAPPPAGFVSEIDIAFANRGLSDRRVLIYPQPDQSFNFVSPLFLGGERVFSVGFSGAANFAGKLSDSADARLYGVIFPRGFVAKYSADYRDPKNPKDSFPHPNFAQFKSNVAPQGFMMILRAETSTAEKGQVHLNFTEEWERFILDGAYTNQSRFFQNHALGIFEADKNGLILRRKIFGAP